MENKVLIITAIVLTSLVLKEAHTGSVDVLTNLQRERIPTVPNENLSVMINKNELQFTVTFSKNNTGEMVLDLKFANQSGSEIRLLDLFDPIQSINMSILCLSNGIDVYYPLNSGKLDFPANYKYKYIPIAPGKSFIKTINLSKLLTEQKIVLTKGLTYQLQCNYHNQYGKDCIEGFFISNEVTFVYKDK